MIKARMSVVVSLIALTAAQAAFGETVQATTANVAPTQVGTAPAAVVPPRVQVSQTTPMPASSPMAAQPVAPQPAPAAVAQVATDNDVVAKIEPPVHKKKRALPGVGTLKVNSKLMHGSVVRSTGDGTEIVLISKRFPNRIATPFSKPRVVDSSNVNMQVDGSNIFISPKDDEPFAIFVTGSGNTDPVISLTMVPKDIPSQTISLQVDSSQGSTRKGAKVDSYTQQIIDLLRTVASGRTPEGYSEGVMPNIVARQEQDGLIIIPVSRYSGSNLDIYKYRVENNKQEIELSETSFYQPGVRAVSIYPNAILRKGETTTVFVLADKSVIDGDNNGR